MNTHDSRFELIRRCHDGDASPEDVALLETHLRDDTAFREAYVRYMNLDVALETVAGAAEMIQERERIASSHPKRRSVWSQWLPLTAAAAAIVLAMTAFWWSQRGVEVEILQASGTSSGDWVVGSKVRLDHLTMVRGSLQMRLPSGVLLDVVAPVEMQLVNAMHVRVSLGQVTADVGDDGKGFIVDTAQAQVVDLGTKFGVDVAQTGLTDVVVFQGEVELFDRKSAHPQVAPMTRLVEGEAVRVDARQQLSRIMNVNSAVNTAEWSTRGGGEVSLIASVRDNLRDPAAKNYYRIISGGLREDARAFVGRRHEWNGLDATGIPAELLGADLVQTFVTDRLSIELEITVTVSCPAVVYVLFDSRIAPPSWLAENFTNTGARIGVENAPLLDSGRSIAKGPGAGNMAPFAVWKRELPQAGSITLGPPREAPDQRLLWMYGIAVKPL